MAGARIAARTIDFLENDARFGNPEPGAAVFFRNQRGEITGFGKSGNELIGIRFGLIDFAPVGIGKIPAELSYALPDGLFFLNCGRGFECWHQNRWYHRPTAVLRYTDTVSGTEEQ